MPSPVPTPVAAALGLVPTVLDGVRNLPGKAVQLPVYAVSHALTSIGTVRQGYDDLAERGERLIAKLRGTSFDELEDRVEDRLQGTPLARPYDVIEDGLEDAAETVTQLVRSGTAKARKAVAPVQQPPASTAARKATRKVAEKPAQLDLDVPAAEAPKGEPTPPAPKVEAVKVETAASPEVVEKVEEVSATVGGEVVSHDELPLPDYDHLTLGSLRGRMRSLDLPQLIQIRDYEKAHANRLPIVTMLDNRIAKLATDPTTPLSGGGQTPEEKAAPAGGSKVSPQTADRGASNPTVAFGGLGGASKPSS
ncbi:MAG: hypothetical protein EPO57_09070 [Chitinophagaceae bacterium]|nr:MAG: hypothetical protein EPO57_09070 [Chitinophagaceae bacterium]